MTTQEFSDNVVEAIAENCGKNFLPVKIKHNQIQLENCMQVYCLFHELSKMTKINPAASAMILMHKEQRRLVCI